jgi:aspartate racemase
MRVTIDGRFGFGVIGGLGALAGADVMQRLIRATAPGPDYERYAIVFEQQSFPGDVCRAGTEYDPTGRKLHAFSLIRRLETRGVDAILLPCFINHTFVNEIAPNVNTPIVDLMAARAVRRHASAVSSRPLVSGRAKAAAIMMP